MRRNFSRAWDQVIATTPQIALISGHGIDYCQRIIDTYLPRRTDVADMQLWEQYQRQETSKMVSIAAARRLWSRAKPQ
ncbi:hypothetical protein [Komagataeibacter diospyri]|uniref:Uncharacterized protein n=1 Tax=Komagataeibacter diospyri TaxID=1932662 RepID=A0A4V0WMB5_9PROT|nr:hypothetical protein [Komagataeibacter diospyri]GCE83092.1 hypothetical protein MSKU9_1233 [Komagataeibacter diospyri]